MTDLTMWCTAETNAAERFAAAAERHLKAGKIGAAINCIDTANCAAKCAMQAHDELWAAAGQNMTSEEFEAFEACESVQYKVSHAACAVAGTVKSINDAYAARK